MWSNFVETSTGTGPFQHHSEYCWYWWCERWRHVDFIYFYFISYHIPTHKICPELQNSIASGLAKVAAYDFLSLGLIVSIWYFLTIVYKPREGVTKKGNKTLFRTVYINIYNARVELSNFHIRYAGQNAINHGIIVEWNAESCSVPLVKKMVVIHPNSRHIILMVSPGKILFNFCELSHGKQYKTLLKSWRSLTRI